ncbi:conserved hypothetical protein [Shewanella denitrificans OS217]|uniref:DUF7281 domain-containing protein n=1 Tax=Shewanella denitrificans (strain OS217 / ATCC BAA-1090 / DSM 15013) TaxID=318161 RepID=Q12JW0_SHEDO|nr:hypothetical protein [Shewanella denitrificans]ABE56266.1 conserved hypothetical protein [Shewanella denitrificans OS217]
MASLSKAQIKALKTVVIRRSPRVSFSANWQAIHKQYDIGEPDGAYKHLHFQAGDHDLLREMVQVELGIDLLTVNFELNRSDFAKHSHKEKLANIRPEANHVLIKLPLTPPSAFIDIDIGSMPAVRVTVEQALSLCAQLSLTQLIVVENLDSFDAIAQMNFDAELKALLLQSAVIYRGSGAHSPAGCKRLLRLVSDDSELSQKLKVIAFTDLDPAGLQIAHLLKGCSGLIAPSLLQTSADNLLNIKQINDVDDFNKQFRQQAYLDNADLGAWQGIADWLKQHRISIKQQHFLSHNIKLSLIEQ